MVPSTVYFATGNQNKVIEVQMWKICTWNSVCLLQLSLNNK
jgi:hypothetical protein